MHVPDFRRQLPRHDEGLPEAASSIGREVAPEVPPEHLHEGTEARALEAPDGAPQDP